MRLTFVTVTVGVATAIMLAGCRRTPAPAATEYHDAHPLPEDPMVVEAPTIGKHGGRFVFAETAIRDVQRA